MTPNQHRLANGSLQTILLSASGAVCLDLRHNATRENLRCAGTAKLSTRTWRQMIAFRTFSGTTKRPLIARAISLEQRPDTSQIGEQSHPPEHAIGRFVHGGLTRAWRVMAAVRPSSVHSSSKKDQSYWHLMTAISSGFSLCRCLALARRSQLPSSAGRPTALILYLH